MSSSEASPTWATNRDRLAYLLAEYKVPVSLVVFAAGIWATFFIQALPSPPGWVLPAVGSVVILAIPSYVVQLKMFRMIHDPSGVLVGVVDPGDPEDDSIEEVYGGVEVPPDTWAARDESAFTALSVPDSGGDEVIGHFDFLVTRFSYYDSIDQIEVRGCEQATLTPGDRATNAKHAEEVYEHMHAVRRKYSNLKATLHGRATDLHDAVVMQLMLEGERAELVPDAQPTQQIKEMEEAIEGLPDAPEQSRDPAAGRKAGLGDLEDDDLSVGPGTFDSAEDALENRPEVNA